jgi:DNA polymerase
MGGTVVKKSGSIIRVLEFYEALGFDRLPVEIPGRAGATPVEKAMGLEKTRQEIGDCTRCGLSKGRKNIVFGEGNPAAELMFIGEGPGREEDLEGRPFVGDAGKLLDRLINRMGFEREEVYIANVVKCRPPMNRDPRDDEMATCLPFLGMQIRIISPRVIMTLGRVAAQALLEIKTPISRLRGRFIDLGGIPLMPTFHPAYLLRNPRDKMLVWADALKVLDKLGREAP